MNIGISDQFAPLPTWSEHKEKSILNAFNSLDEEYRYYVKYITELEFMESLPQWFKNESVAALFLANTAKFNIEISKFHNDFLGENEDVKWNGGHGSQEGETILIDKIKQSGLDPKQILVFRRAPLSEDYQRFWTSDYIKVRDYLQREIPSQIRNQSQILVSTLSEIMGEEGLIQDHTDVNIGSSFMRKSTKPFNGRLMTIVGPHKFNQI